MKTGKLEHNQPSKCTGPSLGIAIGIVFLLALASSCNDKANTR